MTINIKGPELKELKPRILVLGVGGAGGNANMSETNMLLKQILSKEGTVQMDSTNVGTAFAVGSRQIQ